MSKRTRLEQQLTDCEARWLRLQIRHAKIKLARDLETRVEEQLRLEAVLTESDAARAAVELELDQLEAALAALPGAGSTPAGRASPVIFFSHARADRAICERLVGLHAALPAAARCQLFVRHRIPLGSEPRPLIEAALQSARIILLLISADYLADEELDRTEVRPALLRHEREQSVVIPVLLRPCMIDESPLAQLQVLPRGRVPVSSWPEPEPVLQAVAAEVNDLAMRIIPVS
jgi:hypothetical protein